MRTTQTRTNAGFSTLVVLALLALTSGCSSKSSTTTPVSTPTAQENHPENASPAEVQKYQYTHPSH